MDLLTYLKNYEPDELVHFGGDTYCTRAHDSLKISNGKWCWFSRVIGDRTALDYLIKVEDYSFTAAVERIMGQAKKEVRESSTPLALKQYLADHPEITVIALRLDNDFAGRQPSNSFCRNGTR